VNYGVKRLVNSPFQQAQHTLPPRRDKLPPPWAVPPLYCEGSQARGELIMAAW